MMNPEITSMVDGSKTKYILYDFFFFLLALREEEMQLHVWREVRQLHVRLTARRPCPYLGWGGRCSCVVLPTIRCLPVLLLSFPLPAPNSLTCSSEKLRTTVPEHRARWTSRPWRTLERSEAKAR